MYPFVTDNSTISRINCLVEFYKLGHVQINIVFHIVKYSFSTIALYFFTHKVIGQTVLLTNGLFEFSISKRGIYK